MKTTKTYRSDKLTVNFTFNEKSLTTEQLRNISAGFKFFLRGAQLELKNYKYINKFTMDLTLIGDSAMRKINFKHRQKDKTTDVLSFPMEESVRKMKKKKLPEIFLGDVLISKPVTAKQAREFSISFEREFFHLLTHGLLHLLGYDHELSPKEERIMFDLELKILKKMVVQLPKL